MHFGLENKLCIIRGHDYYTIFIRQLSLVIKILLKEIIRFVRNL